MKNQLTHTKGHVFGYPAQMTWEWTSKSPVRSIFPLWLFYGLPMNLLKWVVGDAASGAVSPRILYYSLRMLMATLSLVLEDWAVHDLVRSPQYRRQAVVLVASSYVTWTFQSHTFSNSIETLLVLWSVLLIERISASQVATLEPIRLRHMLTPYEQQSSVLASIVLSFLVVLGTFNRITFPAFVLIPGVQLLRHISR